jgi:fatty-acyl-CoA synthase
MSASNLSGDPYTIDPASTFAGFLRAVRRTPTALALSYRERNWSYDDLLAAALAGAERLKGMGVNAGDRVAAFAKNSDCYVIAWLATQAIKAVHVPLNFRLRPNEVAHILKHSGSKVLLFGEEFQELSIQASSGLQLQCAAICEFSQVAPSRPRVVSTEVEGAPARAQIAYTSGTESTPKGAVLTDTGLVYEYMSCIHVGEYNSGDIVVHALPLYHCAQMHCFLMPHLFVGSRNVILDQADPQLMIDTIERYAATSLFAPPTVWIALMNHPSFAIKKVASLRKAFYGASIMPKEVLQSLRASLPWVRMWNYYGQTEIGPLATALRPEEIDARPTSAGRPVLFVETRIVDDDMNDVPSGTVGEVVHRSPQLLQEYFDDPQRTNAAFHAGWFKSGDLGVMDSEGYLSIVDRKKDMIKSGGENVSSREVEEVIFEHAGVAEAAVVGVSHPRWIEAVTAVIVLRPNAQTSADEIIRWCAERLSPYKCPKAVHFTRELPRSPSGKILKRQLRDDLANGRLN